MLCDWFLYFDSTDVQIAPYLQDLGVNVGRVSHTSTAKISYYQCKVGGCRKKYRVVNLTESPGEEFGEDVDKHFVEEVRGEIHDHLAEGMNLRGLSTEQKNIVNLCERRKLGAPKRVIDEFTRLAATSLQQNKPIVPTPTSEMISSYLSNRRKIARRGVAVGMTTLQDLENYSNINKFGT